MRSLNQSFAPILLTKILLICCAFFVGCATHPRNISPGTIFYEHPPKERQNSDSVNDDDLSVKFFGTGCCLIRRGDAAVLTDPFFTHYPFFRSAFGTIKPDEAEISAALTEINTDLTGVRQLDVFIGHAHYDHIAGMVPLLKAGLNKKVRIHGSKTAGFILQAQGIDKYDNASFHLLSGDRNPQWQSLNSKGNIKVEARAHPITHPPHLKILGKEITLGDERYEGKLDAPPTKRGDYRLGQAFAFEFRFASRTNPQSSQTIFLTTSSTLPDSTTTWPESHPNLILMGTSIWENSPAGDDYPDLLLSRLQPRDVALVHYNNLFKPRISDPIPFVESSGDYKDLIKKIRASWLEPMSEEERKGHRLITPGIGSTIRVCH